MLSYKQYKEAISPFVPGSMHKLRTPEEMKQAAVAQFDKEIDALVDELVANIRGIIFERPPTAGEKISAWWQRKQPEWEAEGEKMFQWPKRAWQKWRGKTTESYLPETMPLEIHTLIKEAEEGAEQLALKKAHVDQIERHLANFREKLKYAVRKHVGDVKGLPTKGRPEPEEPTPAPKPKPKPVPVPKPKPSPEPGPIPPAPAPPERPEHGRKPKSKEELHGLLDSDDLDDEEKIKLLLSDKYSANPRVVSGADEVVRFYKSMLEGFPEKSLEEINQAIEQWLDATLPLHSENSLTSHYMDLFRKQVRN
jgi:hypothetical protein